MRIIKHNEFVPNREYLLNIFMKTDDDTKDARMYATYLGKRNLLNSSTGMYFFMVRPVNTPMEDAEFEKIKEFEDINNNTIENTNQPQLIAVGEDKIFDGDVFNRETVSEEDEIFGVFYESNKELRDKLKSNISKKLNKTLPGEVTQNIIDYLPKRGGGKKTRRKKGKSN